MKDQEVKQVQGPETGEGAPSRDELIDEIISTLGANYRALRHFRTAK